jgi:hypothetical protein
MPHSSALPATPSPDAKTGPSLLSGTWPHPADTEAAGRLVERFSELGRSEAKLARDPAVRAMLLAIGGNAPFLADLAIRDSAMLRAALRDGGALCGGVPARYMQARVGKVRIPGCARRI